MRAIIQKVTKASVKVEGELISEIGNGYMILLAVKEIDNDDDLAYIKRKIANLRIFEDQDGKMNLSIKDTDGEILLVSQFTLYGDRERAIDHLLLNQQALRRQMLIMKNFVMS